MLFLMNKLNYITQINNEIINSFYAYAVLLLLQDNVTCVGDGTYRIGKKTSKDQEAPEFHISTG